jgi:hypothetical protein
MNYQDKYLKYKNKYLLIKKQLGATITDKHQVIIDNLINNFTENSKINKTHNKNERPIISNTMEEKINNSVSIYTKNTSKKISNKMWGGMKENRNLSTTTSAASSAVPIGISPVASSAVPIGISPVASSAVPIGISPVAASPLLNSPARAGLEFITKEYRDKLFEMNNYEEILLHIFNGNDQLHKLANNNHREIIGLINFIEKNYPTENKYYFIICISFCFTNSPCDIIEYLIYKLGLDRLIQIVYEINYGSSFNQIIHDTIGFGLGLEVRKLDERKIYIKRILIFHKLLECYSEKPQIQFEELLMKLFSIQNNSFISSELLNDLINFLVRKKFKLFEFLLENKSKLINFIRLLKENIRLLWISERIREIIGTTEQQSNLFSNI